MKNYEDFQDDDIVIDFANVKMTKRDFEEFYNNYKVQVCPCSSPDRDERIYKDKEFFDIVLESCQEFEKDEESIKSLRKILGILD